MFQQVKGIAYRAWMARADDDRSLARSALVSERHPRTACYLALQAMEGYVKAQLTSLGEAPEGAHGLLLLLDHCIQSSKSRQFALSISHTSLGACPNP